MDNIEIPEFCVRRSERTTRKRKTEFEQDPDFDPAQKRNLKKEKEKAPSVAARAATSTVVGDDERKRVRRAKIDVSGEKEKPKLHIKTRDEGSIDNWKEKAKSQRQRRAAPPPRLLTNTLKEVANNLRDADSATLANLNCPIGRLERFGSDTAYWMHMKSNNDQEDGYDQDGMFEFDKLPKFVMGTGAGSAGGPPEFEYRSLWDFKLEPMDTEDETAGSEMSSHYPWAGGMEYCAPNVMPNILSVVGGFHVGSELDLRSIAEKSSNVQFNPDKYAPLIMRIREPRSTGLIFRTGKVIVSGTKSEEECYKAARKFGRLLQKQGYPVSISNFEIQNVLASADIGFRVRLNELYRNKFFGNLCYEPELFPGVVIPVKKPRVKVIVFCTGSVLMTGAKSAKDVMEGFESAYPLIKMYGH